jgi:hypothetical protein
MFLHRPPSKLRRLHHFCTAHFRGYNAHIFSAPQRAKMQPEKDPHFSSARFLMFCAISSILYDFQCHARFLFFRIPICAVESVISHQAVHSAAPHRLVQHPCGCRRTKRALLDTGSVSCRPTPLSEKHQVSMDASGFGLDSTTVHL